jgi:hypothetical protein
VEHGGSRRTRRDRDGHRGPLRADAAPPGATISRNQLEIEAILNAGVRAFVITAVGLHRDEQIALLRRVMTKLYRICHQRGPFIFNITQSGLVTQISNGTLRRRARGRHSRP